MRPRHAINEIQISLGMSQAQIAEYLNVHPATVSVWSSRCGVPSPAQMDGLKTLLAEARKMRGRRISAILKEIGRSLGKDPASLLGVSQDTVDGWRSGVHYPSIANIEKLKALLMHARAEVVQSAIKKREKSVSVLIKSLGKTHEELMSIFGVSLNTIKGWEKGRQYPSHKHRKKLEELSREQNAE